MFKPWDTLDFALFAGTTLVKEITWVGVLGADDSGVTVPVVEGRDDSCKIWFIFFWFFEIG